MAAAVPGMFLAKSPRSDAVTGFDTATFTAQGLRSRQTRRPEVGTFSGHPWGDSLATTWDSATAMDIRSGALPKSTVRSTV